MASLTFQVNNYFQLTKPKVTLLNVLVGVTCFVLATYPSINFSALALFSIVGYLSAGGCGVLNSVYDRDIDRLMKRTSKRAIPSGFVTPQKAGIFGTLLVASSLALSYFYLNPLTTAMVGLGAVFYLLVYTLWLKRTSAWNVVIGGIAGCFAALSGWAAAANSLSPLLIMVVIIGFLWQPGHLWALAIKKAQEYKAAGVPMLPVTIGIEKTSKIVFALNLATAVFAVLPMFFFSGPIYLTVATVAGAAFVLTNRGLLNAPTEASGFRVFIASMLYLMCLMVGLILDRIILSV